MASRNIDIVVRARDEASKVLGGISGGSLAAMAVGAAAAYVSFSKLTEVIRASINAAAAQEVADQKLAFALRSVGDASASALAHATALAGALQQQTTFTDDAIQEAQAMLAVLGRLSGDGLDRATRASLDLATALGIDLSSAATLMAKAAQGNTTALARYGIVIQEGLGPQEKFAELLRIIETRMGGAAQDALTTYAGGQLNLKNRIGELLEAMGEFVTQSSAVERSTNQLAVAADHWAKALRAVREAGGSAQSPASFLFLGGGTAKRPDDARDPADPNAGITEGPFPSAADTEKDLEKQRELQERHNKSLLEMKAAYDEALNAAIAEQDERRQEQMDKALADYEQTQIDEANSAIRARERVEDSNVDLARRSAIAIKKINEAKRIEELKKEMELADSRAAIQQASFDLSRLLAQRVFGDSKNAARAYAAINIAEGITAVWAKWAANPYVAAALTALVAAAGAVQISMIERQKFAMGGLVTGGIPGQDSVPAMLMPGEYVLPRHAVEQMGSGGGGSSVAINLHFGGSDSAGVPTGARKLALDIKDLVERSGLALTATHIMRNGVPVPASRL